MGSAQGRALRNGVTFYAINLASNTQEIDGSTTRINWSCNVQFGDWYNWGLRLHVAVNGVEVGNWAGYCTYRGQIVINVSGSRDIGRSTGYQSVVVKAWTTSETVNGYGGVGTTTSCQCSEGVNAKPSYTISYNANGGSGAPGNQTKWYGTKLILSSTKPTRTGHNFLYWTTNFGSGTVKFNPGATYTENRSANLYANWQAHTYTVSYNANGGSGAPGNQTKTYGVNLTLSGTKPTRTNYNFKGWGTSSSSTTASYQPGSTYTNNSAITLYAIWELAWLEPRITNLQATRCDSAGSLNEDGQYAKVTFNWASDRTISNIKIVCNGVTTNASGSGTSGSVSVVVGNNGLNTETQYTIRATVTDAVGSAWRETVIAPMNYIMDIAPNGSAAFGKPANQSRRSLEMALPTYNLSSANGFSYDWHPQSAASYKILARSNLAYNSTSANKSVRISGIIGSWTAGSQGSLDITVPLRDVSATSITLNAYSPQCFSAPSSLMVIIGSDNYIYFIVWRRANEFGYYNLEFFGEDITIIDSDWSPTRINGTVLFDSNVRKTDQFGGYPAKYEYLNGYPGLALPDKTRSEWVRTTYNGFIPYQSGGASALGTESWPFNATWTNNLNLRNNVLNWSNLGGLKGRVMKQIWSGTWSSGSITVPELPYYNMFVFHHSSTALEPIIGIRSADGAHIMYYGIYIMANQVHINGGRLTVNGTAATCESFLYWRVSNNVIDKWNEKQTIFRIYGVL